MRFLLLFISFVLFTPCISVQAQNQAEMNQSAGATLEKSDIKLNMIYQRVLSENAEDQKFCSDLKEAQRAWIKFVEFHIKTVFPLKDGETAREVYGSMYPAEFAAQKTLLIDQRIKQLEGLLHKSP